MQQTGTKEYQCRDDCVGKLIHWELCKRLECGHAIKRCMLKLEYILESEMHKILRDF